MTINKIVIIFGFTES